MKFKFTILNALRSVAVVMAGISPELAVGQSVQYFSCAGGPLVWDGSSANWGAVSGGPYQGLWASGDAVFEGTGGTVNVASGISVGHLSFTAAGYSLAGGSLTLTGGGISLGANNVSIGSALGGMLGLNVTGSGKLTLSGSNNYSGATRVDGGTVSMGAAANLPSASALTLANGGTLLVNTGNTAVDNALTIASGDSGVFKGGTGINQQVRGDLSGVAGNLILDISNLTGGGLNMTGTAMGATASGSVITLANAGNGNTAYLFFNSASAYSVFANSKLTVNSTGTGTDTLFFVVAGGTVQLGALDGGDSGSSTLNNGAAPTLKINGTTDGSYAGKIPNGTIGTLTKNGTAIQEFNGAGTAFTAATTFNEGVLKLTKTTAWASNIAMHASNAVTLQLNSALLADSWTFSTQITGGSAAAKIEKTGPGTVILTPAASSSYGGSATEALKVSAGKLYLNAPFTTAPAVTVADSATFGGTATAAAVVVHPGGGLEGGYSGSGALTAGVLTFGAAVGDLATVTVKAGSSTPVVVTSANGLIANGGAASVSINVTGTLTVGSTYPLIDYGGTLGGGFGAFKLGTLSTPGLVANLVNNAVDGRIDLYVSGFSATRWAGNQGNEWTTPFNWVLNTDGVTPVTYANGDMVVFDNSAATRTLALNSASVSPTGVTFDNDAQHPYSLQGSYGIAAGTITKNGDGTVTIGNANDTSGAVQINGGTVSISQSAGLGTGSLNFANGATLGYSGVSANWTRAWTLDTGGGTLDVTNSGSTLTLSSAATGEGGLIKAGAGTLSLTGSNAYRGPTLIRGGTLSIDAGTNLPAASTLTLANNGTLLVNNANTPVANKLVVASENTGVIKTGSGINQQVNGNLSGVAGNLILDVSNASNGGLNLMGSAMETTAPAAVVTLLNTSANQTYLFLTSVSARAALANATLVMSQTGTGSEILYPGGNDTTVQFGALEGGNTNTSIVSSTSNATVRNTVRINGTADGTFTGVFGTGVSSIIKSGAATQTFARNGATYGAITVEGGVIAFAGTYTSASSISVANGAGLLLQETGSLQFKPSTSGTVNGISGNGSIDLRGIITLDLTNASSTPGSAWKLIDTATLTETYGTGFAVDGFTETATNSGVWTSFDGVRTWTFAETSGILSIGAGVFYYRYDGNFADSSGSGNDGTQHGAAAIGATLASGSGSLMLDGADGSFVSLAAPVTHTASQPWTLTWWAKRDLATPDQGMLLGTADGAADFVWLNDSQTGLRFCSSTQAVFDFTVPKDAELHHYALVADGAGALSLYLDGHVVATLAGNTAFSIDSIGKAYPTPELHYNFKGSLDEIHMLDSALGESQIAQIYRNESPVTRLRVVLIGGQSNADGQGVNTELPAELQTPLEDVPMAYRSPDAVTTILTTLRPGLAGNTAWFGPEIRLGHMLENLYYGEAGTRVAIIKYAKGATSLAGDWKPGGSATTSGDGPQYVTFQNTVAQGMVLLAAAYPLATLELDSMVWMQGESDAMDNSWAAAYQTNLTSFIADVRATFGSALPFVIARLSTTQTYFDSTRLGQVRTAQEAVAAADPRTAMIDTDTFGLKTDNIHFNTHGQLAMGDAFANETAYYAWMTDTFSGSDITGGLAEPDADPDGDGQTNYREYLGISDPMSGTSLFRATIIIEGDGTVSISYPTSNQRTYQVEQYDEAAKTWQLTLPDLRGTGASTRRSLGAATTRGMYRVSSDLP